MAKFVLIDHSISDLGGHHYEYAVRVLQAAERAGFEPVLATNRKFRQGETVPWPVHPVYEFGFWPERIDSLAVRMAYRVKCWLDGVRFRARFYCRYSVFGLTWSARHEWAQFIRKRPSGIADLPPHLEALALIGAFKAAQTLAVLAPVPLAALGLLVWMLLLPVKLFLMGLRFLVQRGLGPAGRLIQRLPLSFRRFPQPVHRYSARLRREIRTYYEFAELFVEILRGSGTPEQDLGERRQAEAFARDTVDLVRRIGAGEADVFFVPTIAPRDMLGLADALRRVPYAGEASWHLLFRRNIFQGKRAQYGAQQAALDGLRDVFANLARRAGGARFHFYTDTEELTYQHEQLGIFPFHTLPIPHTYAPAGRRETPGPLRITYLGDARREKGFHLLPHLISDLAGDYLETGKASFAIQANFNIPGGEPEAAVARGQMEHFPREWVELYKQPLRSEEYRAILLAANINLLLYDDKNYYARSSGVLIESLAAGIPVIVPAGCWLSRQFLAPYYRHQKETAARLTLLASHRKLRWKQTGLGAPSSNGERLTIYERAWSMLWAPAEATHLLVAADFGKEASEIVLEFRQGPELRRFVFEPEGPWHRASVLIPLEGGERNIWLSLVNAVPGDEVTIRSAQADFLRRPAFLRAPRGAVGLIYQDPEEISGLLREMIDNYQHYRRSALEFADQMRQYHNPDRMVRELLNAAGISAPVSTQTPELALVAG